MKLHLRAPTPPLILPREHEERAHCPRFVVRRTSRVHQRENELRRWIDGVLQRRHWGSLCRLLIGCFVLTHVLEEMHSAFVQAYQLTCRKSNGKRNKMICIARLFRFTQYCRWKDNLISCLSNTCTPLVYDRGRSLDVYVGCESIAQ